MEEQNQTQPTQPTGQSDAEKNKAMAIVGYIIPILFFIPLVTDAKNSPFAKFHANQQLNLLISWVVVNVVGGVIPFIGWFLIFPLGTIFLIVVADHGNHPRGERRDERVAAHRRIQTDQLGKKYSQ